MSISPNGSPIRADVTPPDVSVEEGHKCRSPTMHDLGQSRATDAGQSLIENGEQLTEKIQVVFAGIDDA